MPIIDKEIKTLIFHHVALTLCLQINLIVSNSPIRVKDTFKKVWSEKDCVP